MTGKPGSLIGSPVPHDSGEAEETGLPQNQSKLEFLKRQDVFVKMGINQDNVNC